MFMFSMFFLILGGLAFGSTLFLKKDFLSMILGKYVWIACVLIGASALAIGFYRDTYLPFLGETVMPCSVLKDHTPENATEKIVLPMNPGTKVLFWAAEPETEDLKTVQDWRMAYLGFKNAGIAVADESGTVTLQFRKPQAYTVPRKGLLESHVHYRICGKDGFLGRVETQNVTQTKERVENFSPAEFPQAEAPVNPTEDNTLYYLAQETENQMIPLDQMGTDESPQPAGADYEKAFLAFIPQ